MAAAGDPYELLPEQELDPARGLQYGEGDQLLPRRRRRSMRPLLVCLAVTAALVVAGVVVTLDADGSGDDAPAASDEVLVPVSAVAASSTRGGGDYDMDNVLDGDSSTYWCATGVQDEWLQFDVGFVPYSLSQLRVLGDGADYDGPHIMDLEYLDAQSGAWVDASGGKGLNAEHSSSWSTFDGLDVSAQDLRLMFRDTQGGVWLKVFGVEFLATNESLAMSCPGGYFGSDCEPCPVGGDFGDDDGGDPEVCAGNGMCDDGPRGSGECYCDVGWGGDACEELDPPTSISYGVSSLTAVMGEALMTVTPTVSGGQPQFFAVAPSLPPGLFLDVDTGALSGTATARAVTTDYVFTAGNLAGNASTVLSLTAAQLVQVNATAARASSLRAPFEHYAAMNAFDGTCDHVWSTAQLMYHNSWLEFELAEESAVARVSYLSKGDGSTPQSVQFMASPDCASIDDSSCTFDSKRIDGLMETGVYQTFPAVLGTDAIATAQVFRLYFADNYGGLFVKLCDVQLYVALTT